MVTGLAISVDPIPTGEADGLFEFLTNVKLSYSSKCARRPVINRTEGEEIDIGTWTFSPMQMTATIRVTDVGKSMLENWFNSDDVLTIYLVSDSGHWIFTDSWFKVKKCTFENSVDENGVNRKWKFSITVIIESAEFVAI